LLHLRRDGINAVQAFNEAEFFFYSFYGNLIAFSCVISIHQIHDAYVQHSGNDDARGFKNLRSPVNRIERERGDSI
jgi:hypothetical protein